MKPAKRIIERFGGNAALARALGHRNPTTVQGWAERGYIPGPRHAEVYAAAERVGIHLTAQDFVDLKANETAA